MPKTATKKKKIPKNKLLLPRPLSWSGLDLWERDPEQYKQKYFFGKELPENDAMRFGKHISKLLEGKEKARDHTEKSVQLLCQKCGNPEYEIKAVLKSNYGDIELIGYLDDIDTDTCDFIENKTGLTKWNNKKAENHGQLHYYYLLIILTTGKRPRKALLQHLDTVLDDSAVFGRRLTGTIHHFEVYLEVGHELEIRRRIENAAYQIDKAYREVLKV